MSTKIAVAGVMVGAIYIVVRLVMQRLRQINAYCIGQQSIPHREVHAQVVPSCKAPSKGLPSVSLVSEIVLASNSDSSHIDKPEPDPQHIPQPMPQEPPKADHTHLHRELLRVCADRNNPKQGMSDVKVAGKGLDRPPIDSQVAPSSEAPPTVLEQDLSPNMLQPACRPAPSDTDTIEPSRQQMPQEERKLNPSLSTQALVQAVQEDQSRKQRVSEREEPSQVRAQQSIFMNGQIQIDPIQIRDHGVVPIVNCGNYVVPTRQPSKRVELPDFGPGVFNDYESDSDDEDEGQGFYFCHAGNEVGLEEYAELDSDTEMEDYLAADML